MVVYYNTCMSSGQIHTMKEISITGSGISRMCRLCLSSGAVLLDMFSFSSEITSNMTGFVMRCTSVPITRGDGMPNLICQSCYTQLEKTHQFFIQIKQSDRILRRYIQQLYASDKPIKAECSVQPSEESVFYKDTTVKCESEELNDEFELDLSSKNTEPEYFNLDNKNNEELCLKSEIKVELIDDKLSLTTECEASPEDISFNVDSTEFNCEDSKIDIDETKISEDMTVNLKENKQKSHIITSKLAEEVSLKSQMKFDKIDDNLLLLTSNDHGNEIICENTKTNITLTDEKPFQCDVCKKCFSRSSTLNNHKRIHSGEKPYQCDICKKCFSQSHHLVSHKSVHTDEKPYQCDGCKKCFSRSSTLNIHKRIHSGENLYQCDICKKCFCWLDSLTKHKRIHTDGKPYQCDVCKKYYSRTSTLNNHKRIHSGENLYQCDICKKCFCRLDSLTKHKRIHTGDKPYQCDICEKCFSQSSNLNTHKRVHTGEKPYQCDLCKKLFCWLDSLNKHKRIHTEDKSYQ